ncbi:protein-disulfide reductase DsbD [Lamprobacter modestohalophilus]|uniref:protein-disulfide reductase DsbD n=1 Tax=Lamprobacter modestohalophilus TaxID=1064514 RepID=UPI002ADEBC77|nr:protein-disulfide reductase DsbD [Lamprobacter modestohalophilus]MEA1048364.1 protein-disulfide reductase DsbD [Lamprobacter modestohalophilus]
MIDQTLDQTLDQILDWRQRADAKVAAPSTGKQRRPLYKGAQLGLIGLLLLVVGLALPAAAVAEDEFLQPDQAFQITGDAQGPDAVTVSWDIEPGYYLYGSKFRFESKTPGFELGQAQLPPAETKTDQFFGEVEIYRDRVEATLPVTRTDAVGEVVRIEAQSQGCADAGFCYPPQRQSILLELPRLAAVEQQPASAPTGLMSGGNESTSTLPSSSANPTTRSSSLPARSLGFGFEDDILPAEEAFQLDVAIEDPQTLALRWRIAPETYLYQQEIELRLENAEGVQLGPYELPEAEIKPDTVRPDGTIGDIAIYQGDVNLSVPLLRGSAEATSVTLVAKYQGCAERGICYPPVTDRLTLDLPPATTTVALTEPATAESASPAPPAGEATDSAVPERVSEQDQIAARLAETGIFGALAIFFVLGLLLSFTPCVFPMIPILSGIIAGQGSKITTRQAFFLSLAYVLAMALTYAIVGVIAGLFGANLQAAFQNPWVLATFAAIFVALSLSMFGFYDLQLPSSVQTKLTQISNKQQGGTLTGAAIMGALSALIVGPCVAPPLMGALIFIGKTGDAVLGFFALLGLGLGMGAPLLAIGTSAGKLLPRAGAWMDSVKAVFGVLLLAVAVLLVERVIPAAFAMALWALLLISAGVYLGALTQHGPEASGWSKLWKSLGVALLVYGVLMLVGAAAGGKDTIQPLRGLAPAVGGGGAVAAHPEFKRIKTVADLDQAVAEASAGGKPVMLDFYADWCVSCKEMERYTFPDPAVQQAMQRYVLLQADVTANDAEDKALMQERFGIPGPPAMMFFDSNGQEQRGWRLVGFVPADEFAAHLNEFAQ